MDPRMILELPDITGAIAFVVIAVLGLLGLFVAWSAYHSVRP